MAKIISVQIEGFISVIEPMKYKFDRPGLNIITGKNGAGKTLIFNALAYGLYGQTLKPKSTILPWPSISVGNTYRGCCIVVKLDGGYKIHRCNEFKGKVCGKMGRNRLVVSKDGIELLELRDKKDAQRWITNSLGYTWDLFRSAVLFPQELASLFDEDGPTKKRILEDAFASNFITVARSNAELTLEKLERGIMQISADYHSTRDILANTEAMLVQMKQENTAFIKTKGIKIMALKKKIKELKNQKKSMSNQYNVKENYKLVKQAMKSLNDRKFELKGQTNPELEKLSKQYKRDIERYESDLEEIQEQYDKNKRSVKNIKCDSCGQPLRGKALHTYKESLSTKRMKIIKRITDIKEVIRETRKKNKIAQNKLRLQDAVYMELDRIEEQLMAQNRIRKSVKAGAKKINQKTQEIKLLQRELFLVKKQSLVHDIIPVSIQITELEQKVKKLKSTLDEDEHKIEIQRWLIKEPLSNSGLKAFIFDSMLKRVNHYLTFYKQYIGFTPKLGMDLESHHKDFQLSILKDGQEVPYADLSKGQKQLAKVVMCFAINKTLRTSKPINILLLDELFETLDPENVEIIGNIISKEAINKSVHIITHHQSFNPTSAYKTFVKLNDKKQTVIEQKYRAA